MQNSQLTEHEADQKEIQDSLILPNRINLARCQSCYATCRNCKVPDQQQLPNLAGKIATRVQR